ncbi:MAG: ATP-binding protein [Candidatus Thorarchaeota archaeon]|nr:MAG: ATP-binding protein [Candidatus Thorarchaeota archaeon]
MSKQEEVPRELFTDFDGQFDGVLARVIPVAANYTSEWAGSAARYDCRIKVRYHKELVAQLEEGMMVAVPNFKGQSERSSKHGERRFTVMVISKVWPQHYGLGGVSDSHYFPVQMEIIEQAVPDWSTDDQATMMVQMTAIPINYDLCLHASGEVEFRKGFSYPLIGARVHVINMKTVDWIYNSRVKDAIGFTKKFTSPDPRKDPRVGTLRMFMESDTKIPIYVDLQKLVRYHFGVFSFTGGGKSNLLSNLFRRLIYHSKDTKIVIFDISSEYSFLLCDVFSDPKIPSKIILEEEARNAEEFAKSIVKPRDFEDDPEAEAALKQVFESGQVTFYNRPLTQVPTFGGVLTEISGMSSAVPADRPTYLQALDEILHMVTDWMEENNLSEQDKLSEAFIDEFDSAAKEAVEKFSVYKGAALSAWANTRSTLKAAMKRAATAKSTGVTVKDIVKMLGGPERIVCISMADPDTLRDIVIRLTGAALRYRKRNFEIKPQILFVFDEAQEFIPSKATGALERCSNAVERLLRQGRKYGLGGVIATQRIAYLNTNIMQQLHTFFVGTLPRPYDRTVVSSSFQIDLSILDKTLEFPPGSWLLSSYIATGLDNVPVFIAADNSEDVIREHLQPASS